MKLFKNNFFSLSFISSIMLVFPASDVMAESPLDWLEDNKVLIRSSFEASRNEARPAQFQWIHDENSSDTDFYKIDLAVAREIKLQDKKVLADLFPVIEWHRNSKATGGSDNLVNRLSLETSFSITPSPLFISSLALNHNLKDGKNAASILLLTSIINPRANFWPGCSMRFGNMFLRYYPYLGYEYRDFNSKSQSGKAHFLVLRGNIEYWPSFDTPGIQFLVEYTHREILGEVDFDRDNIYLLVLDLNFFLDEKSRFAIGYSFRNGMDPISDFSKVKNSSITFKIRV